MNSFQRLLLENKAWVGEKLQSDPNYFTRLSKTQTPEFLWIGCSDSRVPANEVTGASPGEIFVHRNIANMVVEGDLNLLSVLDYAVNYLHVKHVIVCGHYGCGGVKAAASGPINGIINNWLENIRVVLTKHEDELSGIKDDELRSNRHVELNLQAQVHNLTKTSIIQNAWNNHRRPHLHGWVYSLSDGILKPVVHLQPEGMSDGHDNNFLK